MSKRSIGIDRLEIRLKGVAPHTVRAAVGDLGHELLGRLARQSPGPERTGSIDHLDSGTVSLASEPTPPQLRRTIADTIAASINSIPRKVG
ncbi:MAG TPA: hypothetical protein VGN73_11920 [Gemmatimonadaceae bacterium]|nr:hypothetical protein [Gemmatimonadaceae bacterium]